VRLCEAEDLRVGMRAALDAMGPVGYGQQMAWIEDGVRGLGDARSKAIRKLVADLNRGISDAP
jgi:hypothetical protein